MNTICPECGGHIYRDEDGDWCACLDDDVIMVGQMAFVAKKETA